MLPMKNLRHFILIVGEDVKVVAAARVAAAVADVDFRLCPVTYSENCFDWLLSENRTERV